MRAPRSLLLAAFGLLGALVGSCILFVSPPTGGDTCQFAGVLSSCGACVRDQCQPQVNACCGDNGCAGALHDLETCATSQDRSCTALQSGEAGNATGAALSACVSAQCRGECQPFAGTPETACTEPNFGQGTVCGCQLSTQPNDFACSATVYPSTLCCAPAGWPAAGLECDCQVLGCTPTADGCFCALVSYTPTGQSCMAPSCCVDRDTCTCGAAPCTSFETKVPSCDVTRVHCKDGQVEVASCALRDGG